jgi:hypothetical protein
MTWDAHHHREEVLRAVVDEANSRRDGTLPMEIPGVAEIFGDELALIGALLMRWHTRLAGNIERALMERPSDLEPAVLAAWRDTARELGGIREILDSFSAAPTSEAMATTLEAANRTEWTLLAAMAGRASAQDAIAARVGEKLERSARAAYNPIQVAPSPHETPENHESLFERLKAHLAA